MSAIINGSSPSVTFSDGTTQSTSAIVSGYVPYANLPAGSVLQVVQSTYNTFGSNNTTSYADTGLSASITPKFSTSKILVVASCRFDTRINSGFNCVNAQIVRGSTSIAIYERTVYLEAGASTNSRIINGISNSMVYLDSPATTSSTTYKIQYASDQTGNGGIAYVNNASSGTNTLSTITLIEVAA